jgi:hypothetical protein
MRAPWIVAAALSSLSSFAAGVMADQRPPAVTFDADKVGAPPPGFAFIAWRQPSAGRWTIQRQGSNGYISHEADPAAAGYALAIAPPAALRDVEIAVRLRLAGGGRAGGAFWRYQDPQNYYAAVLDLARQRLSLCRVSAGNRVFLEIEDDLELDPDAWHTLKIVHDDQDIRVSLGGIRVFEESDRRGSRTLSDAGRQGLLAHGNADVWFDDLRIQEDRRER